MPQLPTTLLYAIPLLPGIMRWLCLLRFTRLLRAHLSEDELDRDNHKAHILALAGFTFAALLALIAFDAATASKFPFAIYDLFLSFVSFTSALNLQHYKSTRWQDQVGTALTDIGAFGQYLAVLNLASLSHLSKPMLSVFFTVALGAWVVDYLVRLRLDLSHFHRLRKDQHARPKKRS